MVTRQVLGRFGGPPSTPEPPGRFVAKEHRILECVLAGLSNKEIATEMGLSEKTVRNQLTSIYERLGVRTRAAAAIAYERLRR